MESTEPRGGEGVMEDYIGRAEHDEFVRRIEAEDRRQNHRLNLLEETVRQTSVRYRTVRWFRE